MHRLMARQARRGRSWRDRREVDIVRRLLAEVPACAHILDLGSECGRWLETLVDRGFRVTCVDSSEDELRRARQSWDELRARSNCGVAEPSFALRDIMHSGFPDRHFDAVLCNRLFHHIQGSDERIHALREIRRISKGPVVLSFLNAFALGATGAGVAHLLGRKNAGSGILIPAWSFLNEIRRAGLVPIAAYGVLWGISPLWHVVSTPTTGRADFFQTRPPARSKAG
jgi:2-polyprenyl-3-methyl-5-hydroxy-6-metoxy-1,4-benzoquinol methylase